MKRPFSFHHSKLLGKNPDSVSGLFGTFCVTLSFKTCSVGERFCVKGICQISLPSRYFHTKSFFTRPYLNSQGILQQVFFHCLKFVSIDLIDLGHDKITAISRKSHVVTKRLPTVTVSNLLVTAEFLSIDPACMYFRERRKWIIFY